MALFGGITPNPVIQSWGDGFYGPRLRILNRNELYLREAARIPSARYPIVNNADEEPWGGADFRLKSWRTSLRDCGNWRIRRRIHLFLIFAILVLTCNAKITWEFLRSPDQARAIRALKIATTDTGRRTKAKRSPKRGLLEFSTAEASESQAGSRLSSDPPAFGIAISDLLPPPAKPSADSFTRQELTIPRLVVAVLWTRPPPSALTHL